MQDRISFCINMAGACKGGSVVALASVGRGTPDQEAVQRVSSPLCVGSLTLDKGKDAPAPIFRVGTTLHDAAHGARMRVTGRIPLICPGMKHALHAHTFEVLTDFIPGQWSGTTRDCPLRAAWVTLSDKGAVGQRMDTSGPAMETLLLGMFPGSYIQGYLLPDDGMLLKALLTDLALVQGYDVIVTTGGTGIGQRDVTPEATLAVLEKRLHGFEHAMMAASLGKTPYGMISRAVAGILGRTIIVNVPGSRKAAMENLEALLPAMAHAIDKLHGSMADCASLETLP